MPPLFGASDTVVFSTDLGALQAHVYTTPPEYPSIVHFSEALQTSACFSQDAHRGPWLTQLFAQGVATNGVKTVELITHDLFSFVLVEDVTLINVIRTTVVQSKTRTVHQLWSSF